MGELRPAVRQHVATALAAKGIPARVVAAYLPPDLLGWLVERAGTFVADRAVERRAVARRITEAQVVEVFRSMADQTPTGLKQRLVAALLREDGLEAEEEYALWRERGDADYPDSTRNL